MRKITFVFIAALLSSIFSNRAESKTRPIPPLPKDYSKVDIYLGTRDMGEDIYTKYGHTIVRVVDNENNTDTGYNWGAFDFNEPGFIPKFLKGILIYQMSYNSWWQDIEVSKYEERTMWMERVNLTAKQKEVLLRRINWQAQPENIKYPYYFFYDNCSTRVRDYFDEAIGGKIKSQTFSKKIGRTYRDKVMEYNASSPLLAMGQDIILSSEPDKEMSEWDDMFIPIKLRDHLMKVPAYDDNGQELAGLKLLSDTQILTSYPRPTVPPINGYMFFWLLAGIPALLGLALYRRTAWKKTGVRLIGFANVVLGFVWGLFALFMALSWAFGGHTVLPHNVNLWLMWPTDWLFMALGFALMWRGKLAGETSKFGRLMHWYFVAHFGGVFIFTVLGLSHAVTQDVSRIVLWFVPLTALVYGAAASSLVQCKGFLK